MSESMIQILVVSGLALIVLLAFFWFGWYLLNKWLVRKYMQDFEPMPHPDWRRDWENFRSTLLELLNKRNDFWTAYGQFVLATFVIACVTILLLAGIIDADAGLPILSGIGAFAIGKGASGPSTVTRQERNSS